MSPSANELGKLYKMAKRQSLEGICFDELQRHGAYADDVFARIGIIDGSVLTGVGLLVMFSVIKTIPEAIKAVRNIRVQKGDSSVEISSKPSAE